MSGGSTSNSWALAAAAASVLGAVAASGWAWREQRRQQQQSAELVLARSEAHALANLLDVWQWHSDAQHRLTLLRPPHGASAAEWPSPQSAAVWEHFQAAEAAGVALQSALRSHAPLNDLPVEQLLPDGRRRPLLLRGLPRLDAEGRFAGYVGTAREVDDPRETLAGPLLQALPIPAIQFAVRSAAPCRIVAGNAAAAQWLGLQDAQWAAMGWSDLLARIPLALRPAIEQAIRNPPPGAAPVSLPEGWELRLHALDAATGCAGSQMLLLLHRAVTALPQPVDAGESDSFGYTVSHDLRAPIRVVEGFTKIVKEDYGRLLDRIGNDHLDRVLGAAARMNSMIDSLLALSQLTSRPLARQPVNLSQLVGYIVDDLRRQAPERDVQVVIEPGLTTHGDTTLLRVALENLLGNAWKYTAKRPTARIWFEGSVHEGRPAFTVRDNGAGFDMRFTDRLFGVFQRLHSANDFQGTGVGLASVRRIIRRHGGDIWAEGEVDRGARFQFWLPQETGRS